MKRFGRSIWIALAIVLVAVVAGLLSWYFWFSRLAVGDVRIDPKAKVNTSRMYNIVVWDYELPILWSQLSHAELIRQAAAAFTKAYPYIQIELVLKSWEDESALPDAIAAGTPPDVAGLTDGARLLSSEYQVPLERYLRKEAAADLFPVARQAATSHRHLWAWPRYIDPARWAVYLPRWQEACQSAGIANCRADGYIAPLSASDWTALFAACRTKQGACGLAANLLDPRFFYEMMSAIIGVGMLNEDGTLAWPEANIQESAALLKEWLGRGFLPADFQNAARSRLGRFWAGRTLALAPTTPWLWQYLWQHSGAMTSPDVSPVNSDGIPGSSGRLEEVDLSVTWVPPPGGKAAVLVRVPGYAVFRQDDYQGDDHTRAAVMVAEYLSQAVGNWEATWLFGVPAHPSAVSEWLNESRLPQPALQAMLDWCQTAATPPADDRLLRTEQRIMADTVIPGLLQVLKGDLTPADFAHQITALPAMAITEAAGP